MCFLSCALIFIFVMHISGDGNIRKHYLTSQNMYRVKKNSSGGIQGQPHGRKTVVSAFNAPAACHDFFLSSPPKPLCVIPHCFASFSVDLAKRKNRSALGTGQGSLLTGTGQVNRQQN